jgi:predicted phosphodiesterase
VRTLVISDLHLGARTGVDVLRHPAAVTALVQAVAGADRLVLLGDALEVRHGPVHAALEAARPVLGALGSALGAGAAVVLVPGNHDHRAIAPWLEWRLRSGPAPLGLEERAGARATTITRAMARMLRPAGLDVAYPGTWLGDGVYATHGHYLDRHLTVPSLERLGAGALGRALGASAQQAAGPDDYERVLAPLYALLDAAAARAPDGVVGAPGASARAWRALTDSDAPRWRRELLGGGLRAGVAALNRFGLGPLRAELSGVELRRAGLRAMGQVAQRLGLGGGEVVIFGHTHRTGPLPADDASEWSLAGGGRLINAGSWVRDPSYVDGDRDNPYWPGGAVTLDDGSSPQVVRLLGAVEPAALSDRAAPAPA